MPHIIAEYSKNLEAALDIAALVEELHQALAAKGIDAARIKSRAVPLDHFVAGDKDAMIHITLLLLEGRDVATKKSLGDPLHAAALKHAKKFDQPCAVTLEIRDMDKDTYYL